MVLPDERPNTVERRQYFLDTAKRVFASSGFQSTTMEDIAREAGFTEVADLLAASQFDTATQV